MQNKVIKTLRNLSNSEDLETYVGKVLNKDIKRSSAIVSNFERSYGGE